MGLRFNEPREKVVSLHEKTLRTQMPTFDPVGKAVASLSETDRHRLMEMLKSSLPAGPDGSIRYSARANAIKARAPE